MTDPIKERERNTVVVPVSYSNTRVLTCWFFSLSLSYWFNFDFDLTQMDVDRIVLPIRDTSGGGTQIQR